MTRFQHRSVDLSAASSHKYLFLHNKALNRHYVLQYMKIKGNTATDMSSFLCIALNLHSYKIC